MRTLTILLLSLALAACSSTPEPTIPPTLPTPSPMAARTATAAPAATNTPSPTDIPSPTATASPAPSDTPTATPEATATSTPEPEPEPTDAGIGAAWHLPLVAAGMTQMVIIDVQRLATDRPDGAIWDAMGLAIALRVVDDALKEWQPGPEQAGYVDKLRANIAGVGGVIKAWMDGDIEAQDVASQLAPVRASSEQMLSELSDELRALGVSQANIDAFIAEVMSP